ncbi:transposase [Pseudonocardia yuanmonensis]|uniref:transposase n=1 Tax=Pseudonocardia yuanmonensis TaxID=1095914 RepID=UPI003CD076AC
MGSRPRHCSPRRPRCGPPATPGTCTCSPRCRRYAPSPAGSWCCRTRPTPTRPHRLNRSGDRRLNSAIHTIAVSRMRFHPDTRAYVQRRRTQGKSDPEIGRCLKRYITRQLHRQLEHPPATA